MDKAQIKSNGETHNIEEITMVKYYVHSATYEYSESGLEIPENGILFISPKDDDMKKEGTYYTLSDGKKYHESDLVVGLDNIRDHKINKVL